MGAVVPRRYSVLIAFVLGGCAEDGLPLPPIAWEGEHTRVAASTELDELCSGSLEYADAYHGRLKALFGVEDDALSTIYWLPDGLEHYRVPAEGRNFAAFTRLDGTVVSELFPPEHELVHSARARIGAADVRGGCRHALG